MSEAPELTPPFGLAFRLVGPPVCPSAAPVRRLPPAPAPCWPWMRRSWRISASVAPMPWRKAASRLRGYQ